jgi:hypothetical protein
MAQKGKPGSDRALLYPRLLLITTVSADPVSKTPSSTLCPSYGGPGLRRDDGACHGWWSMLLEVLVVSVMGELQAS